MGTTQKDIADRLGLSQRSVAFALSDSPHAQKQLNPETRKRVIEAAARMNYRPNRQAQIMRTGRSGIIGLIQSRSFYQSIIDRSHFAARAIHDAGYRCLSIDLSWCNNELPSVCHAMLDARVEGLVMAGPDSDFPLADLKPIIDADIPVVGLGSQRLPGIPHVITDVHQGMKDLTRHLIGLGHRKLALIVPHGSNSSDKFRNSGFIQRVTGFEDALAEAGLSPMQVVHQPTVHGDSNLYESGRAAADRLLRLKHPPDVLVCSDDYWAVGAFKACADLGVRVPHDIAITGFNNSSIADYTASALTTVEQPVEACGRTAVDMLIRMITSGKHAASNHRQHTPVKLPCKLPCKLIVRQSCGAGLHSNTRLKPETQIAS